MAGDGLAVSAGGLGEASAAGLGDASAAGEGLAASAGDGDASAAGDTPAAAESACNAWTHVTQPQFVGPLTAPVYSQIHGQLVS